MLEHEKLKTAQTILEKHFGYEDFRANQIEPIVNILNGFDTFIVQETSAGKSICYQIPALMLDGITIVISPLISLMKDQVDSLVKVGIKAAFINSSKTGKEIKEIINQAKNNCIKLLYIAPERLKSEDFLKISKELNISMIAIDEVHCVSQYGHDFRPSYKDIAPFIRSFKVRPIVVALTATATKDVIKDTVNLLSLKKPTFFIGGVDRPNLSFTVVHEPKLKFLINYLRSKKDNSGIIYCSTRPEVESLTDILTTQGLCVVKYHSKLKKEEKSNAHNKFLSNNNAVMVTTNAFGMGIDKPDVRFIIHYNMPNSVESYYQEAGRAGRDGKKSECYLLFDPDDINIQKFLIESCSQNMCKKTKSIKLGKLDKIIKYCYTEQCLRKYILEYFDNIAEYENCNHCCNCLNSSDQLSPISIV